MWNFDLRLCLTGEPVRSNFAGVGEVTVSGTRPIFRFLNGAELTVDDCEISPIADDDL